MPVYQVKITHGDSKVTRLIRADNAALAKAAVIPTLEIQKVSAEEMATLIEQGVTLENAGVIMANKTATELTSDFAPGAVLADAVSSTNVGNVEDSLKTNDSDEETLTNAAVSE